MNKISRFCSYINELKLVFFTPFVYQVTDDDIIILSPLQFVIVLGDD